MANREHEELARLSKEAMRVWRKENPSGILDLEGASLSSVDLRDCDLRYANLNHADLRYAKLDGADLSHAKLNGAKFDYATLVGADFSYAKLKDAVFRFSKIKDARFDFALLREVRFINSRIYRTDFKHASLHEARLSSCKLKDVRLSETDLSGAHFVNIDLESTDLHDAAIFRTKFSGCKGGILTDCRIGTDRQGRFVVPPLLPEFPIEDALGLQPIQRRRIADAQALRELARSNGFLAGRVETFKWRSIPYRIWGITSLYGQSIKRWVACSFALSIIFAATYATMQFKYTPIGGSECTGEPGFWTGYYFSMVTFTTLGFGDVTPASVAARIVVAIEVVLGYIMLGGLISIFSNKMTRIS